MGFVTITGLNVFSSDSNSLRRLISSSSLFCFSIWLEKRRLWIDSAARLGSLISLDAR